MNTTFLDACYSKKTSYMPIWFMRQAGRYLPEYRELKGDKNILDIVRTPEMAAQICLQPVTRLGVDAAILYADIMIPLMGIDVDLAIVENLGPVIKNPIANIEDVKKLRQISPKEDVPYLLETIKILRNELEVPLIGFSAAPFTLASYLVEGKPSRDFMKIKTLMYTQPEAWTLLMEKLTDLITTYLKAQAETGIQAIQLFDSWIGALSEEDYKNYVLPYSKRIFENLQDTNLPLIHFGTNTAGMLESFASVNSHVVGVDWRIPLDKAWERVGMDKALQGNLDPVLLASDWDVIKKHVDHMLEILPKKEGYIFNLGHGILQTTPVENAERLVDYIHTKTS